jgi:hypothetical protein
LAENERKMRLLTADNVLDDVIVSNADEVDEICGDYLFDLMSTTLDEIVH